MLYNKHYKVPAVYKKDIEKHPSPIQQGYYYTPLLMDIMTLQQTIGNREVQHMFKKGELLAKLYVNQPGDVYEQEADRVAQKIINMGDTEIQLKSEKIKIQKKGSYLGGDSVSSQTEAGINSLKGKGHPMEPKLRDYFQPRFGVDLGGVRIHTGSNADRLARAIRARAFTLGNDVVFAKGEYRPETTTGKKLIAHEFTHVIQQRGMHLSPFKKGLIQKEDAAISGEEKGIARDNTNLYDKFLEYSNKDNLRIISGLEGSTETIPEAPTNRGKIDEIWDAINESGDTSVLDDAQYFDPTESVTLVFWENGNEVMVRLEVEAKRSVSTTDVERQIPEAPCFQPGFQRVIHSEDNHNTTVIIDYQANIDHTHGQEDKGFICTMQREGITYYVSYLYYPLTKKFLWIIKITEPADEVRSMNHDEKSLVLRYLGQGLENSRYIRNFSLENQRIISIMARGVTLKEASTETITRTEKEEQIKEMTVLKETKTITSLDELYGDWESRKEVIYHPRPNGGRLEGCYTAYECEDAEGNVTKAFHQYNTTFPAWSEFTSDEIPSHWRIEEISYSISSDSDEYILKVRLNPGPSNVNVPDDVVYSLKGEKVQTFLENNQYSEGEHRFIEVSDPHQSEKALYYYNTFYNLAVAFEMFLQAKNIDDAKETLAKIKALIHYLKSEYQPGYNNIVAFIRRYKLGNIDETTATAITSGKDHRQNTNAGYLNIALSFHFYGE